MKRERNTAAPPIRVLYKSSLAKPLSTRNGEGLFSKAMARSRTGGEEVANRGRGLFDQYLKLRG